MFQKVREMGYKIPSQLQGSRFRFIKLVGKIPKEKYWDCLTIEEVRAKWAERGNDGELEPTQLTNYAFDDPSLTDHRTYHGNYGVMCGVGDLAVFDADNVSRLRELGVMDILPATFSVQSQPNHIHIYYYIKNFKKLVLNDPILKDPESPNEPLHLADFQGYGSQVVGASCFHPTKMVFYKVVNDSPIVPLGVSVVEEIKKKLHYDESKPIEKITFTHNKMVRPDPFESVRIEDVFYPRGKVKRLGNEIQGTPPTHSSVGGKAFRIFPQRNLWYCDHHKSGGGVALALAVKYGIIRCDEAKVGALKGEKFRLLLAEARAHGDLKD